MKYNQREDIVCVDEILILFTSRIFIIRNNIIHWKKYTPAPTAGSFSRFPPTPQQTQVSLTDRQQSENPRSHLGPPAHPLSQANATSLCHCCVTLGSRTHIASSKHKNNRAKHSPKMHGQQHEKRKSKSEQL